jgi:ribosomal protein S18 acetylase RimI-like enzyme
MAEHFFYTSNVSEIHADQLQGFFVGWPNPPSPDQHLAMLAGSAHVWIAQAEQNPHAQVIGFVNALSDGQLSAFIPALEVLPAYQGRGIGTELMRRMLATLDHHYSIDLSCDPDLVPFYRSLGGREWTGMIWRNPARLYPPSG